ncbi:MAG TPA: hypothetical protein VH063_18520 [Gaiellaceae bacterium]|jgi:hypothetical protein|nr:hypothetical protein [Gaiellaceae bacterium]
MAKLSNQDVRALIEAERQKVLANLGSVARKERAAREKELNRRRKFRARTTALLLEGRALGMAMTDMAHAAGVTRQMAHHWLRDEE